MSNEPVVLTVETVKKKLKKYTALKEHEKVKEYLRKLHHTPITSSLIQETRIDSLVRRLASHKTTNYSSSARKLLKRWHHKRLLSKSASEVRQPTTTDQRIEESSESPASDDNKKRKVLSLAQYLENKKHILSSSSKINTRQSKLTDSQIQVINAQFKAATEKLTASAPDMTKTVNETLIQADRKSDHRVQAIFRKASTEPTQAKFNDLWTEDDDDDEHEESSQLGMLQSRTVNSNDSFHIEKVR